VAPDADAREIQLAGILPRAGDQRLQVSVRRFWPRNDDERHRRQHRHRLEVRRRVVGQGPVHGRAHGVAVVQQEGGVTIGRCSCDLVRGNRSARARAILDDDRLAEQFAKRMRDDPRKDVRAAAGAKADDEADGPRGVVLGEGRRQPNAYAND
jgi:hypothetical protein